VPLALDSCPNYWASDIFIGKCGLRIRKIRNSSFSFVTARRHNGLILRFDSYFKTKINRDAPWLSARCSESCFMPKRLDHALAIIGAGKVRFKTIWLGGITRPSADSRGRELIFKAFKSQRCYACKRKFQALDEQISSSDRVSITMGVSEGRFVCQLCKSQFHGKCGKAGQVNPKSATVKCPKCGQMQKSPLPFVVTGIKAKSDTDGFFDQGTSQV